MTVVASVHRIAPLFADLPTATAALGQIAGRSPQLDQPSPINKAALDRTYLLNRRRSIEQTISSIRRHSDRAPPKPKSP
jgi:hypothetical protein